MNNEELIKRIEVLEGLLIGRDNDTHFSEKIRDIVFFDQDATTATTTSLLGTDSRGDTFTVSVTKNPTKFIKTVWRGQICYVPVYINP